MWFFLLFYLIIAGFGVITVGLMTYFGILFLFMAMSVVSRLKGGWANDKNTI